MSESQWQWPPKGCLMCRGTGVTLRRKDRQSVLTPRPSEAFRKTMGNFYEKYEDTPCRDCHKGVQT